MLAESKEPTINIRTEFLADKFTIKLISIESIDCQTFYVNYTSYPKTRKKLQTLLNEFPLFKAYINHSFKKNQTIHKSNLPLPFPYNLKDIIIDTDDIISTDILKSKNPLELFQKTLNRNFTESTEFYTDGSKIPKNNFTGAAIYSSKLNLKQKFKITKSASIFTAEAIAILQTLKFITTE